MLKWLRNKLSITYPTDVYSLRNYRSSLTPKGDHPPVVVWEESKPLLKYQVRVTDIEPYTITIENQCWCETFEEARQKAKQWIKKPYIRGVKILYYENRRVE